MHPNHPYSSNGAHGYDSSQNACEAFYTPEECLAAYQTGNDQYWSEHNLTMNHSRSPSHPSQSSISSGNYTYGSHHGHHPGAPPHPFRSLPQEDYTTKRPSNYQRQPSILFKTSPTVGYVRLSDFYNPSLHGTPPPLEGADDAVFSEDNPTQKRSIRLEIHGCKSYEKQINVFNPANSRSITRRRLAEKIAKEIYDFMSRHQGTFADPSLGLGAGANGFNRIVLIEFRHVSRSSWQPVLGVL